MANSFYCDDSYLQAQQEQEEQEYLLYVHELEMKRQVKEHQEYLEILANDLYGSSITLMIESN